MTPTGGSHVSNVVPMKTVREPGMRIRKAVFPAAGLGTRFLPATKAQPKEMLPLVDKPLIQYVVEEAVASGITNITIITGRGKNAIEDHFDVSWELEQVLSKRGNNDVLTDMQRISSMAHIAYVRQKDALGLGHAVLMSRSVIGNESFAVMLGDDIIDSPKPCLASMVELYEKLQGSIIAMCEVPKTELSSYGVVVGAKMEGFNDRVYRVHDVVEKPDPSSVPSNFAIIGRYILTPQIFSILERITPSSGGEIQLTDGIRRLLDQQPVYAYKIEGTRYDAGDKLGFLKATVEFALKRGGLGEEFRAYLKQLDLK